jgi:hypothetical protein
MATIENDTRIKLAGDENKYKILIAQNQGASGLYDTYQKAVNAIMTSSMDEKNKQAAIDVQYQSLQAGMQMYSDVDSLGIDKILATEAPLVNDPLKNIDEPSAVARGMPPGLTPQQKKAWFAANPEIGAQILAINGIAPNAIQGISDTATEFGENLSSSVSDIFG